MKKLEIMKNIDSYLFDKLDELQAQPGWSKIADLYASLEEKSQEIVKATIMAIIFIVPLLVVLIMVGLNSSLRSEQETKKNMIEIANSIIQKQSLINGSEKKILGSQFINSASAFKSKIANTFNLLSIDTSKVKISNFDSSEENGLITRAKIDIKFNGLTNDQLFSAINNLVGKDKIRIDEIQVRKESQNNLLDGIMTVLYFSKDRSVDS